MSSGPLSSIGCAAARGACLLLRSLCIIAVIDAGTATAADPATLPVAAPATLPAGAPFGATPPPPPGPVKSIAPHVPACWKVGTAAVIITPEKNLWMAGYAARKKPAEGKVQDLFAKAIAIEDQKGGRAVIVTVDLIGIPQALRHSVAQRVEKNLKLPPAALVMNASHTHSGPILRAGPVTDEQLKDPKTKDCYDYTKALEEKLIALITESLSDLKLKPARLTWSHARCGFAMNRRRDYTLPPGHPNANKAPNPDGPVDHDVPALRIESPDGTLRAVLFGYACHNTSLGFYYYCGDYAGFAQQYLQEHRENFTAHFMIGCGADQNPYPRRSGIVPGVTDLELAQQHGRSLANAVEVALTANPRPVTGLIRSAYEEIDLAYADEKKPKHAYPIQILRLGDDLELIALGSEVTVDYSLRLKKEFAGKTPVWVAGYSNDYAGYIPSRRLQDEGGYETETGWAKDLEQRIIQKVHELHGRVAAN